MLFILLVTLLLLLFFAYQAFRTCLSPSVLLLASFVAGSFFAILGDMNWKMGFDVIAYFLIVLGFVSMIVGETFGRRLVARRVNPTYIQDIDESHCQVFNMLCVWGIIILCLFCLRFYIKEQISLAYLFGYNGVLFFKNLRAGLYSGAVENSTMSNICEMIIQVSFYFFTYYFIRNRVVYKVKIKPKEYLLLVPMLIYLVLQVFSAARAGFIAIAVYLVIVTIALQGKRSSVKIRKLIKYVVTLMIVFFVIFLFLGTLTEKVNDQNGLESIYVYAGSSIVAFSEYVKDFLDGVRYSNKETFVGLYNILKSFTGGRSNVTSFSLNFISFNNGSKTNIYTAFRSYLNDYGVFGLLSIQLLIGTILGFWSAKILKSKDVPSCLNISLYSYYIYRLICCLFTPGLTSTMFTVGNLARICFATGIYWIIAKNNFLYKRIRLYR